MPGYAHIRIELEHALSARPRLIKSTGQTKSAGEIHAHGASTRRAVEGAAQEINGARKVSALRFNHAQVSCSVNQVRIQCERATIKILRCSKLPVRLLLESESGKCGCVICIHGDRTLQQFF